jgi:transcriptional regulator with XRE-family HTH domain
MSETLKGRRTTDEWVTEIGATVRQRRLRAGLTQEDLARLAGIGISTLKHFEAGTGAHLTTLIKVVRTLGAEDWLAALAPPPEPAVSPMQLLRQRQRAPLGRRRVRRSAH